MKLNKKALGFVVMSLMAVTTAVAFASTDQESVAPIAAAATTEAVVVATEITEAAVVTTEIAEAVGAATVMIETGTAPIASEMSAAVMSLAMPASECTPAEKGNE